jgi:hypothetical protein
MIKYFDTCNLKVGNMIISSYPYFDYYGIVVEVNKDHYVVEWSYKLGHLSVYPYNVVVSLEIERVIQDRDQQVELLQKNNISVKQ